MNQRRGQGFSLIEIMLVVLVLAILAGIALPSYQEHVRQARRMPSGWSGTMCAMGAMMRVRCRS